MQTIWVVIIAVFSLALGMFSMAMIRSGRDLPFDDLANHIFGFPDLARDSIMRRLVSM